MTIFFKKEISENIHKTTTKLNTHIINNIKSTFIIKKIIQQLFPFLKQLDWTHFLEKIRTL